MADDDTDDEIDPELQPIDEIRERLDEYPDGELIGELCDRIEWLVELLPEPLDEWCEVRRELLKVREIQTESRQPDPSDVDDWAVLAASIRESAAESLQNAEKLFKLESEIANAYNRVFDPEEPLRSRDVDFHPSGECPPVADLETAAHDSEAAHVGDSTFTATVEAGGVELTVEAPTLERAVDHVQRFRKGAEAAGEHNAPARDDDRGATAREGRKYRATFEADGVEEIQDQIGELIRRINPNEMSPVSYTSDSGSEADDHASPEAFNRVVVANLSAASDTAKLKCVECRGCEAVPTSEVAALATARYVCDECREGDVETVPECAECGRNSVYAGWHTEGLCLECLDSQDEQDDGVQPTLSFYDLEWRDGSPDGSEVPVWILPDGLEPPDARPAWWLEKARRFVDEASEAYPVDCVQWHPRGPDFDSDDDDPDDRSDAPAIFGPNGEEA